MVQFRSFHTRHALMCTIRETENVSILKHVLCRLMNMPIFFHMKMCNILIIKKLYNSLQLMETELPSVKFRSTGGTILIIVIYYK
jgi:hypothetical protein